MQANTRLTSELAIAQRDGKKWKDLATELGDQLSLERDRAAKLQVLNQRLMEEQRAQKAAEEKRTEGITKTIADVQTKLADINDASAKVRARLLPRG